MRQANVLIADADPLVRLDLKNRLTALGHTVVGEAEAGIPALSLARNLRPDILLLNVALPPVSGWEIAQTAVSERLAAVILTAREDDESLVSPPESGAMAFLALPARSVDLRMTLLLALARFQERMVLEEEVRNLNERMEARKLVGRAKAILMERHGLSERDAFKRIQSQSIALGKQAHEIAQAIITASEIAAGGGASKAAAVSEGGENRSPTVRPVRGEKAALDGFQP